MIFNQFSELESLFFMQVVSIMSYLCEIVAYWSNTRDFRDVIENLRVKKFKFLKQQISNVYESNIQENILNSSWHLARKFS